MSWIIKKLGDVLDIQNGYAFDSKLFSNEGGMPLIRIRDIKNGVGTQTRYIGEYDNKYVVKKGDLLIGMDGEFGCYEWKDGEALLNQRVCRLQNFQHNIFPKFLLYGINSYLKAIEDVTGYITVKHISSKQIASIEFPLPSIEIQQKIVAKLDAMFAEIDKATSAAEANANNAETLWQSTVNKVISDFSNIKKVNTFSDFAYIESKLVDPKVDTHQNLIHVGAGNIASNTGELIELKTAKDEKLISGKFLFDSNTILYSKIRPYLKKVVRPTFDGLCSADVYPLKCREGKITKNFLFYLLLTNDFTDYAISGSERAGMPKVNRDHLFSYKVKLPPLAEQNRVTNLIDMVYGEVKRLDGIYKKKAHELSILKQSILQQAFNGELVKD